MKKLMMAMAVVGAALAVNASTVNWNYSSYVYGGEGDTGRDAVKSQQVYFFDNAAYSREKLLLAFSQNGGTSGFEDTLDANDMKNYALSDSAKFVNGKYTDSASTASADKLNSYFAVIAGDQLFISDIQSSDKVTSGESVQYVLTWTTDTIKPASQSTVRGMASEGLLATNGGAGWYTADVPEPTSGLLLLLGVAGLALKRKRA